jgi:lipoprotein NlpI
VLIAACRCRKNTVRRAVFLSASLFLTSALSVTSVLAGDLQSTVDEALRMARTNAPAALSICDRAVARFPTNSEPLAARARLLDLIHRYPEAARDLSSALKLQPASAQLWEVRGEVNFKRGHFQESLSDFNRVLELLPEQAPYHWQRGITLYYAGHFADGRKQFELHRTVNPNDVENAVWHFLCSARESGVTNARATLLPVGKDTRIPMAEIYALYRGTGSADKVLTTALNAKGSLQREALFYAHLYLGLFFDVTGETSRAREHIGKAATDFGADHYMGDVARVHLSLLTKSR